VTISGSQAEHIQTLAVRTLALAPGSGFLVRAEGSDAAVRRLLTMLKEELKDRTWDVTLFPDLPTPDEIVVRAASTGRDHRILIHRVKTGARFQVQTPRS
jgi:hypothetical protein